MKKIFLTSFFAFVSMFNAYSTPFVWEYNDNNYYDETGGLGPGSVQTGGLTGISDIHYKYFFDDKTIFFDQTEWVSDGAGGEYEAPYDSIFFYSNLHLGKPGYFEMPEYKIYVENPDNPGEWVIETVPAHIEQTPEWLVDDNMLQCFNDLAQQDIDSLINKILENPDIDNVSKNDFKEITAEILTDIFNGEDITSLDIYAKLHDFAQKQQKINDAPKIEMMAVLQALQDKIDTLSAQQQLIANDTTRSDILSVLQSLQSKIDVMDNKLAQMEEKLNLYENILSNYPSLMNNIAPRSASVNTTVARSVNNIITNQVSVRIGNVVGTGASGTNTVDNIESFNAGFASHLANTVENDHYEWKTINGVGFWGQGLANYSKKSGKDAFDADTYGVTLGADKKIGDNKLFGMGYTFSNTKANSGNTNTNITGSQVFLYGEYRPITPVYIDGILSYGVSEYKTNTNVNKSDYDVSNLGLNIKTGYDWNNGFGAFFGTNYMNINQEAYTDYLGQKIAKNNSSVLTLTMGGQYYANIQDYLTLNLHVTAIYDALTPNTKTNVDINGISYQIIGENIAHTGFQSGLSLDKSMDDWTFNIGYDFEWRDNFISHTARIKIRKTF